MGILTTILAIIEYHHSNYLSTSSNFPRRKFSGMGSSIQGGSDTFFGTGQAKSKEQLQKD